MSRQWSRHLITNRPHRDWTQNANDLGVARCDGCGAKREVVYGMRYQWCEACWPDVADLDSSTQSKDWRERRAGQERDYGWSPAVPADGEAT